MEIKIISLSYQFSPPLYYEREGFFTNRQYRYGCSISIMVASHPCGGTIANTKLGKSEISQ